VITSRLRYDRRADLLPDHEQSRGVNVYRVWTSRWGRQRLLGRAFDYASFYFAAGWQLWRLALKGDVVVAKTDPPLISVVAAMVARLRGARLINWQQDIFPEAAERLALGGGFGRAIFAAVRAPRNWSLRQAQRNVVVGKGMSRTLHQSGVEPRAISILENWSDGIRIFPIEPEQNPLRAAWGLSDSFVVGYAGNLGRAHDISTILPVIDEFGRRKSNGEMPRITFLFVGGGALRSSLENEVKRRGLANVVFRDYQPREQLAATLSLPDVHLVSLNPKLEGCIVPSKIYAIAAAGRPAIFIGDPSGEVARTINETKMGFAVPTDAWQALRDSILQLARNPKLKTEMGERARRRFEQDWDKPMAIDKWEQLLRNEVMRESMEADFKAGSDNDLSASRSIWQGN
jgi:glycosyltransferase involved in cell wall biosynthesis